MQKSLVMILVLSSFCFGSMSHRSPGSLVPVKGGQIRVGAFGFPDQVISTVLTDSLLAEGIHFHFIREQDAKDIVLKNEGVLSSGLRKWLAKGTSEELIVNVVASVDDSGAVCYRLKVIALNDLNLKDVGLHIPFRKETSGFIEAFGSGYEMRTDSLKDWKWKSSPLDRQSVWIGTPITGLTLTLIGASSWNCGGNGGILIGNKGKSMLVNNYTGPHSLKKGDILTYDFNLRIAPPKTSL